MEDCCIGELHLCSEFPHLLLSAGPNYKVAELTGLGTKWIGIFDSEDIYEEEIEELAAPFAVMENFQLSAHRPDRRTWKLDLSGVFSCKTFLNFLAD